MSALAQPLNFKTGSSMKNRLMLAPLTNTQSHKDGRLSEDEIHWLTMRAKGGMGATMTAAAHVQQAGQGFPGQLGVFSDDHLPGLEKMAAGIKAHNSLAIVQLHHAGMRSPAEIIGEQPHCPSDNEEFGARALTTAEVEKLRDDFIAAAVRCEKAGFEGVEIHGAHGYILAQFLSPEINLRQDQYGGSLENRTRLIEEIVDGIRRQCSASFNLGLRLSPERFGLKLAEIKNFAEKIMVSGQLDYLDMSLWNVFNEPKEDGFQGKTLIQHFAELNRGDTKLGVAGKVRSAKEALACLEAGADFALIGRAAILHHDYADQAIADDNFRPIDLPASSEHLQNEGLSPTFVEYMRETFRGFVA